MSETNNKFQIQKTFSNFLGNMWSGLKNIFFKVKKDSRKNDVESSHVKKNKFITKNSVRKMLARRKQSRLETNGKHGQFISKSIQKHCQSDKRFTNYVQKDAEEITCSICRSELIHPVLTPCHHLFCLQCIQSSLKIANKCPLCRQPISTVQDYGLSCHHLTNQLTRIKYQGQTNEDYQQRLDAFEKWKLQRFIDLQQLTQGLLVDVWGLDKFSWKNGKIITIYTQENGKVESILVEIDDDGIKFTEIIDLPSYRIAGYLCHTQKQTDLLFPRRYSHSLRASFGQSLQQHSNHWLRAFPLVFRNQQRRIAQIRDPPSSQSFQSSFSDLFRPLRNINWQIDPQPIRSHQGFQQDSLDRLVPPSPVFQLAQLEAVEDLLPTLNPSSEDNNAGIMSDQEMIDF